MSKATSATIAQITEVVARVTRILSSRQIKVIQAGMKVGVDYDAQGVPTTVWLPSLADNPSPELLVAIQGFLDKEVAGLLYTDYEQRHKEATDPSFRGSAMNRAIQQIIEDARTERRMRTDFKGSASNFDKNHDFAVKEILDPSVKSARTEAEKMATLAYPAIRAACGDIAYEEFMDGKWEQLGKLGGAILHYAEEIQQVADTGNTFDLTRKIVQKMEDDEKNSDGDGDGDGEGDGDGDGDGEEQGPGSGGGGDDANLDGENKSKDDVNAGDGPGGGSGTTQGLQKFKELDDAFEDKKFQTAMEEKIRKIAGLDANKSGAYVPFSRQLDYVGPLPALEKALAQYDKSTHAQQILEQVDRNSHVIQQQIQKLFMAKSLTRWEPGQKRGKINTSALYRLPQGDPRIFRRKIETNSRDVAVSLVIDMSGSMSGGYGAQGSKIQNACIAALMFSKVLTSLGIKHEISAFTTYYGSRGNLPGHEEVNKMMESVRYDSRTTAGVTFARYAPITNYILKPWDQRLNENMRRATALIPSAYGNLMANNVDGESIELAGRRLLGQKEAKKVMIVMSDGSPASDGHGGNLVNHLKDTVKMLTASGIEMLGLGLQDRSVERFYPKSEVVLKADEIPQKILELTRKMVVGV